MDLINSRIDNHVHILIDDLRTRLLYMATKSQEAFSSTCKALKTGDYDLAEKVIEGDKEINELEIEIDGASLSILARTQPVASDLRLLVSAIRLVVDLERIGDESANIATRVLLMREQPHHEIPESLKELINKSQYMLEESIVSFKNKNTQLANTLRVQHEEIIELVVKALNEYISALTNKTATPWLIMHYILITRAIERIAGRAVNIAEHTYFLVEGINIKHRPVEQ